VQVSEGTLDNPALGAKSGAVLSAASRDHWLHSQRADEAAVLGSVFKSILPRAGLMPV
jgi:hypothetical protein